MAFRWEQNQLQACFRNESARERGRRLDRLAYAMNLQETYQAAWTAACLCTVSKPTSLLLQ
jgi:hypothetical protein